MLNNKQATIEGLKVLGFVRDVNARSRKYLVFVGGSDVKRLVVTGELVRAGACSRKMLVGNAGGLRATESSIERSISLTDSTYHQVLRQIGRGEVAVS
jgi:hypothetical protein